MSLDITLTDDASRGEPQTVRRVIVRQRIFVRDAGRTRELSRAEWDRLYPGRMPHTFEEIVDGSEVYRGNITHNLAEMAKCADLYSALWYPERLGVGCAGDLIDPLTAGLARLDADPVAFRALDPKNGWGDYGVLREFVGEYLDACRRWPGARVSVSL